MSRLGFFQVLSDDNLSFREARAINQAATTVTCMRCKKQVAPAQTTVTEIGALCDSCNARG